MEPKAPLRSTIYSKGKGVITEPIVKKPASWTRQQWRAAVKQARRFQKDAARAEALKPESVKIEERLHAAGLISPRDVQAVRPVHFDTQIVGA
jgi:hypothetical protein